jgi:hypothetical protein
MKLSVKVKTEIEVESLHVVAIVRYWDDGTVDGVEDENGSRIPCRFGSTWEPKIDIESGVITNWTKGIKASVHYKVCDAGEYFLANAKGHRVLKYKGEYVPSFFPGDHYGDYIIFEIDEDGKIAEWDAAAIDGKDFKPI